MNEPHSLPKVFILGSSQTTLFGRYLQKELEGCSDYNRKRDSSGECVENNLRESLHDAGRQAQTRFIATELSRLFPSTTR